MGTATLHIDSVGGFAGPARCFAVDPPFRGADYVTVWAQRSFGPHQEPEACLVPATETGACAQLSVKRHAGSYVLPHEPDTQERIDGAHWLALVLAGYQIQDES